MVYCEAIFIFREGVRLNDSIKIQCGRELFRPIWHGRRHTKYLVIDLLEQICRQMMPSEIKSIVTEHESFSRSGRVDAHQGLDFIMEEFSKETKQWISGLSNSDKWERQSLFFKTNF